MTQLNVALQLAAAGRRIFPSDPEHKRPLIEGWQELASTDADRIRAWWDWRPEAMPAIALEATDLVVDCDPRNGGGETLDRLFAEHPELEPMFRAAPTVITAGGGAHFYFACPPDRPVKNGAWHKERYPGIDIKTKGGFVVAPGAVRSDGKAYKVLHDGDPPPAFELVLRDRARGAIDAAPARPPVIWEVGDELESSMTPGLVALLSPLLAVKGSRHEVARAVGGALAGAGWTDEGIAELVGGLPSDDPDARVRDALEAAARARAGEMAPGFGALVRAGYAPGLVSSLQTMATGGALEALAATTEANRAATAAAAAVELAAAPDAWGTVVELGDLRAPLEIVNHVCEGLAIAPGAPTIVAGFGGLGKSLLVQALALCAATGKPMLETHPTRRCRVLHLDYEQGKRLTQTRYKRLAAELRIDSLVSRDFDGRARKLVDAISAPRVNLLTDGIEAALVEKCRHFDLCIIDSLKAAAPGLDENDSRIREPLDMLQRVSEATGCTFVVIHHARKSSNDNRGSASNENMRGSGAINDAAQTVIMLEPSSHGFDLVAGKVRDGKKFGRMGVSITDTKIETVPFDGLKLLVVDSAERARDAALEEETADKAAVLAAVVGSPGGVFTRGKSGLYVLLRGTSEPRVRRALELLILEGHIREDKTNHTFIATRQGT
jgi:hypothetical protein